MARIVNCVVLSEEAAGLERVPYPDGPGRRIFENLSPEGWSQWIERQTMINNEKGLSTVERFNACVASTG